MTKIRRFLKVIGHCGKYYIYHGGPTSRLEDKIAEAGKSFGYEVETWCTPTGLFISVTDGEQTITTLERIRDSRYIFSDFLFYGQLLDQLSAGAITLEEADEQIQSFKSNKYRSYLVAISAFFIGFLASYIKFGYIRGAMVSGLITCIVYALKRPLARRLNYSGVFSDFISCLIAFSLSLVFVYFTEMPLVIFVMGSLLLIVPGLTLTAAISELAEHNFVSGTVKMVKAMLIVVAMGVAYILVENAIFSFDIPRTITNQLVTPSTLVDNDWFQMLSRTVLIAAFCIFFHIPLRAIPGAVFCGLASVIVLDRFLEPQFFVLASFLAAFTVGIISLVLARIYKWPSQIFSTPGILSLVPGLLALSTFYNIDSSGEGQVAYRVALTSGAIVFGLFTARMPFRLYSNKDDD